MNDPSPESRSQSAAAGGPLTEPQAVIERYARRTGAERYSVLRPEVWQTLQERQRAMLRLFAGPLAWSDLSDKRVVEVGCGDGGNLLELLRMGFSAPHLHGIELLGERASAARQRLPSAVCVTEGDALSTPIGAGTQDMVYQAVVFSSVLDRTFQQHLAERMWSWVRPGGGVLWYDFIYDNPANPDVRGVPLRRVRELFPQAVLHWQRVTLAPPISRRVCRLHPAAYTLFNAVPWLRTHVLCWLGKS